MRITEEQREMLGREFAMVTWPRSKEKEMAKLEWKGDEGYCGCKTARFGELAVVICPPEFRSGSWGYQAFDESDDEAIMYGEVAYEGYGFASEQSVIEYVEGCLA